MKVARLDLRFKEYRRDPRLFNKEIPIGDRCRCCGKMCGDTAIYDRYLYRLYCLKCFEGGRVKEVE